jgi:hypothetical protein
MAALGRILQVIGWLWFVAGLASRIFEFGDIDVFPGLILVFVARAIRAQAARQAPDEDVVTDQPEPVAPPRILNTERQTDSVPPTSTRRRPEPGPKPAVEPTPVKKRNELLQDIVLAGKEAAATKPAPAPSEPRSERSASVEPGLKGKKPMSSAEMIAQARKRWDRK